MPQTSEPPRPLVEQAGPLRQVAIGYLLIHLLYLALKTRFGSFPLWSAAGDLLFLLGFWALGRLRKETEYARFLLLWGPVVFFWFAYRWTYSALGSVFPAEFSFDRWLIALEGRLFGQPALHWARNGNRLLTEFLHVGYATYYLYTFFVGAWLYRRRRDQDFIAMALAVCFGYAISYLIFPLFPLYGPRWALVDAGLLSPQEQRLAGYWITRWINFIQWEGPAFKGGAMPSSHTSTGIVFVYWCWRIGGLRTGIPALLVVLWMGAGAIYGRYHYLTDVLVGALVGIVAIVLAHRWRPPSRPTAPGGNAATQ